MKGNNKIGLYRKDWSKYLSDLKPLLPSNYAKLIEEQLAKNFPHSQNIKKHTIIDAFRGKLKDENKLSKIFTAGKSIAHKLMLEKQKAQKELSKVQKMKAVACILFFAHHLITFSINN
jgi:hypothetical protein